MPLFIAITGPLCTLQYEPYMLNQAATILEHVEQVSPSEERRVQLIHALMAYLQSAFEVFKTDAEGRRKSNEARINISVTFCVDVVTSACAVLCFAVHSAHVLCCAHCACAVLCTLCMCGV